MAEYETILVERRGRVGWITLNRPHALNALNAQLASELGAAASDFDADDQIGCIVITGSERAFAAGADIKEMADKTPLEMEQGNPFAGLERLSQLRTPLVAAVAGFALGGGCELAMTCDIILAADTARFGQPEINLGVIPGLGGTQRLPRAVGAYKAADLVLTARTIDAVEAERAGLASRVVPAAELLEVAQTVADEIAAKSLPVVYAAKEALRVARESTLTEGLRFERRVFVSLFGLEDQKEGMTAFREKRAPEFHHR
ncbi:MAG: enoyl-CoA hydratase/isomerase family protein [Microbacterium ginsengisoli]|jgi:enoyl-CoA hydratase|uniref:enoyl-CoA hydratase-related protein n=1 Tax=Microbacterium TaxID=33882 RepID=UPI0006F8E74C|nr:MULTISPECIES: enoyl-CoA hydratase-related protein [unclassified Microbacterium]MBN9197964.1 enoyl-CoA hydratase/isomerase family protein [Microbacterium ginsengisoli]KQR91685.1 enoyl-CoA hydratase [Microbacterium sp. Leaf347]KQR91822.1 enoyl-CoA hydratase [Microbacterium sp. Leaf351]ODU76517.1 MAG: enoyl-CoA hydratase [Microbacterium sp. SCN 71-21]OJU79512.1 MAG: enoyl-CoA hydratase [Microbacterium sp. 71-23]